MLDPSPKNISGDAHLRMDARYGSGWDAFDQDEAPQLSCTVIRI